MRNFFISSLNVLIGVFLVFLSIGVVLASVSAFSGAMAQTNGQEINSTFLGLAILIGGAIYIMFVGGFMYLGLGIYYNTKRMAEALELRSDL